MPDENGTTTGEHDEGRIDPKTGKPIIIMAAALTGASCVYIVDTVCQWAGVL